MKNLLNYARPAAVQLTTVDVNDILEKTAYFIEKHPSFSSGNSLKRIIKELAGNLPQTVGDPQQLQQVFLNLFLNAADAMPEGGAITIKTSYDKAGETIVIDLQDTGKGIPGALKERIFQPFFTTKRKGTGLGLAVSKRLVEDNGGSIMVMDNPAGGATFRVILPVRREDEGVRT
jgi:signal transduction histidine kinase